MLFNTNHKIVTPIHGETRQVRRFAWKPVRFKTQILWLGWYMVQQGYYYTQYPALIPNEKEIEKRTVTVGNWVDIGKSLIKK